jgi:hypothetical protein
LDVRPGQSKFAIRAGRAPYPAASWLANAEQIAEIVRDGAGVGKMGPSWWADWQHGEQCSNLLRWIEPIESCHGGTKMDRSRKANREVNEATLQHKSQREAALVEEMVEEKLAQLQASLEQLKQTPEGAADLQRRTKAFGECQQIEGETSGQFYAKLRHWLDRDIPQTKAPLHPPRQTDG